MAKGISKQHSRATPRPRWIRCIFDLPSNQFSVEMVLEYAKEMGVNEIRPLGGPIKGMSKGLYFFSISVDDPEKLIKFGIKLGLESVW